MIQINDDESRRMSRATLAQAESQIVEVVRQANDLDPTNWPFEKLQAHTRRGLDQAVVHRLTAIQDVIEFLTLRHQFGERFDEFPAVRKFLARNDLPPTRRIQQMMLELPTAIWAVVVRRAPQ